MINWFCVAYFQYSSIDYEKVIAMLIDLTETIVVFILLKSHETIRMNLEKYVQLERKKEGAHVFFEYISIV